MKFFGTILTIGGKKLIVFFLCILLPFSLLAKEKLTFGIAGVIYKSDLSVYEKIKNYLEEKLPNTEVQIIYSKTYMNLGALITSGNIDIALIGSPIFTKLYDQNFARLLAIPQSKDGTNHLYAYILSKKDAPYKSLLDFKDRSFAFSDRNSKAGSLIPSYFLLKNGYIAKNFFKKIVYTQEHEESIRALLYGFVDGASVNSMIFEHFSELFPNEVKELHVIQKIGPFLISPLVSRQSLSPYMYVKLQKIFVNMHNNEKGREILEKLYFSRFNKPKNESYKKVRQIQNFLERKE